MNRWAMMLADAPPTLQRLIARRQRISLPRSCSAEECVARLRASLCHARTVCEISFAHPAYPFQARRRRGRLHLRHPLREPEPG